jgi:polysaccharide deacetylase 2 family uncharacterized protein YibQ
MKALAVTASILLSVLVLGIGWLAVFPGSDVGEPVSVLQIQPPAGADAGAAPAGGGQMSNTAPRPDTGNPPAGNGNYTVPPGFVVALPPGGAPPSVPQLPPEAGDMRPALPQADQPQTPAPPMPQPHAALQAPEASPAPAPEGPVDASAETGSITLPQVPLPELVEESQYGPLPKVSADGKRPLEAYARPSRYAEKTTGAPVRVAVLINAMGPSDSATAEAIKVLPAPISLAYSAYGRNLQDWVTKARSAGHEVLLQVPLEPINYPETDPGPHTLLTTLPPEENMKRLQWLMSRFTGYVGVTNQMGAKFEAARDAFLPVLEEIKARGLLYVDDGSVQQSTAAQIAGVLGLDYSVANVQIDGVQSPADMARALGQLEALAKERGCAIGVASARPATIKQLAEWAGKLASKGIVLVPVSAAVRSQRQS